MSFEPGAEIEWGGEECWFWRHGVSSPILDQFNADSLRAGHGNAVATASRRTPKLSLQVLRRYLSSAGGAHLRDPLVELARQMRHDAQLPLDQHQLRAMVHLMLLGTKQTLETRLLRFSVGLSHHLRQELRRQRFHPRGKLLSLRSQQFEYLGLGSGLGFLGVEPVQRPEKVEAHQSRQPLLVHLFKYSRTDRDVRQHARHGAHLGRGHEAVLRLRNVLRDLNGVLAYRPKCAGQFFSAVRSHGGHLAILFVRPAYGGWQVRCAVPTIRHSRLRSGAPEKRQQASAVQDQRRSRMISRAALAPEAPVRPLPG